MWKNLKVWYYRKKAKRTLINRYEYLHEVDTVLEEYLTEKVLQGGSSEFLTKGRENLVKKQQEMRENANFVEFLKRIK